MERNSGRYKWNDCSNLHVNEEHVKILKAKFDRMLAAVLADAHPFSDRNGRVKEIDHESVERYNKYLAMYQEICDSELEYARKQDEIMNGLLRRFTRMEEKEDAIIAKLDNRNMHAN